MFNSLFLASELKTIDQYLIEWLNTLGSWGNLLLIFISLVLAVLFSGIIGFEREAHGHSAGLRTHILVAVGSALVMILSIYGFGGVNADGTLIGSRDPARLAAQVVSGIGFLGAGAIIKTGMDTEIGKIAKDLSTQKETLTPLQINLKELAKKLTYIVLGVIALIMILGLMQDNSFL